MIGHSQSDGCRAGRTSDIGRVIVLVQGILVHGVVRGFWELGHVGVVVTAWASPSFFLVAPIPVLLLPTLVEAT